MQNLSAFPFTVWTTACLFPLTVQPQMTKANAVQKSSNSVLNGGWHRVTISIEGRAETNPFPQFRLFHDGYFSMIGQNSTGVWKITFGGTYEIESNLYKEKML